MASDFERAINAMKAVGTEEYLKSSLTVLKIMQNIIVHPDLEKFRKIRLAASVLCKPGMVELLRVIGFQEQGSYLVFPGTVSSAEQLKPWKQQIIESRKQTGQIEGWDVPGTSLKYSDLLGSGKFGDVYKGYLDNQPVAIKTLKPDCGDLAKAEFDRETRIMSKLYHPNVLGMVALVLTSDPISLVLELMKENMLSVLHQRELSKEEVLHYVSQVSEGMNYLHQQSVLHCDLAARNILLDQINNIKISDFGLSRVAGTDECNLVGKERQLQFPIRWTAPEVFSKLYVDEKTDVWSFGILFYEFVTAGSVPYAALSNAEVRKQVQEGHRLAQPEECPDSFFRLMQLCWTTDPSKRPSFSEITAQEFPKIKNNAPNQTDQRLSIHQDAVVKERDRVYSVTASPKKQKRIIKIKEPSYSQAIDKSGGVIRVYTALVPPFRHRTVIPCLPKTSVKDAIQMVLVQLGRDYVDPRYYHIVMLCDVTDQPSRFLSTNEHIYSLKNCKRQFVLCTHQSVGNEATILDAIMASARDNPAMIKALDPCTRGYLVSQLEVSVKQELDWSRSWVAIDGSTMFTYKDEEDENVKECQHYIDLRNCLCEPVNIKGKQKGTIIRVHKPDGPSYLLQAIDKSEVLRWIDAIQVASTQEPSPRLADVVEGAVVQEGYLEYQEFLLNMVQSADLSQFRQTIQRNLQLSFKQQSSLASNMKVDHGRQWSQLKSNGKMQVFYTGKPETLLELGKATKVKFNHPPALTRSADYSIEVTTTISRVILKADLPSEHHEWAEVIQHILREQKREDIIQVAEDSTTPSGYVRLKRFMSKKKLQQQSANTLPMEAKPEDAQVVTNQDEVADGLYEDAKFIEHIKSLMPDLKDPGDYSKEPVVAPPLPPRMPSMSNVKANGAVPVANGRVVNGGPLPPPPPMMLPSQSHSSLSQMQIGSPARTAPSRSSSSYSLPATQWARPLTTSFDEIDHHADSANHFPRMDQQYHSFNQHHRAVSPVPPMHQNYERNVSPPRLDYHAAMEQQRQVQQHYMGQQVGHQRNHVDQRKSHQYQMNHHGTQQQQHHMPRQSTPPLNVLQQQLANQQQPNRGSQQHHMPRQSTPPLNMLQHQQYTNQQQTNCGNHQHLERRISPPYHMGQQLNNVSQPHHHMGQSPNHMSQQQQQNVGQYRQSYYSEQQQHQTALPSSTSESRINSISHTSTYPNNFSLPPPQPVPEGYIKMHSVSAQLSQPPMTTPVDYIPMNSPPINDSPRTYSLNVPTTPPGVEQRPTDTVHKPPQVAPKPSRPPKQSVLLSGGTSNVNPEQQIKSSMPPVIPAKKNSLHRRKGLATYDQTDSTTSNISQQLESTLLFNEPRAAPTSAVPPFSAQSKDVSPPVAPITMPTSSPKTLPPGWFAEMDSSRGQFYYFNRDMGYTTWDYDEVMTIHHENQIGIPGPGWKAVKTADGRTYFYHATSRMTTWTIAETKT